MPKGKKKIQRNINGQKRTIERQEAEPEATKNIEIQIKPDLKTSQSLSNVAKVEAQSAGTIVQYHEQQTEAKLEPEKGEQLPLQSKVEQAPNQVAHQNPLINQNSSQIDINEVSAQKKAYEDLAVQNQPTKRVLEDNLHNQHIGQPSQVIQENSAESLPSNLASLQIGSNVNVNNPTQAVLQPQVFQNSENSNILTEIPSREIVDSLHIESQRHEQIQLGNQCVKQIVKTVDKQAEIPAQLKLNESVISREMVNNESFVSIQGQQERRQRQEFQSAYQHTVKISAQISNEISKQISNEISKQISNEISKQISNEISEQISNEISEQISNEISEQISNEISEQISNEISEQISNEISEQISNEISEQISNEISEQISNEISEQISNEISEQISNEISEQISNEASQQISKEVSEQISNEASEKISKEVSEQISNEASEKISKEVSEQISNEVSEQISNEASQQIYNEVSERFSKEVSEQISNEVSERFSKEVSEQISNEASQQIYNEVSERFSNERAVQIQSQKAAQIQSDRTQPHHEQSNRNVYAQKVPQKTEQKVQPSIASQAKPQSSDKAPQIAAEPAHEYSGTINLQNQAENIQFLQHSTLQETEILRQNLQSQNFSESICVTESVEIQRLHQNQKLRLQNPQSPQIEIKPEVIQVDQSSSHLLDINQAIEIISSVQQSPQVALTHQKQQQIQQRRTESRIFTLVQSEEITANEAESEVKIKDSAELIPTQINVKKSLSFSDLNYSAERSVGKEQQKIQQGEPQPRPQKDQPKAEAVIEIIREVDLSKKIQQIQLHQLPAIMLAEIFVQKKAEIVQALVQESVKKVSQVVEKQVQSQPEVPVRFQTPVLRESQSILSQRQELSVSNKEAIIEQAKLIEEMKSFERKASEIVLEVESKVESKVKEPTKKEKGQGRSLTSKLIISSFSFAVVGGIGWGITKSMQKSLALGVLVAGGAFAALNWIKN